MVKLIKIEEINREIRYTTGVNQWQSTQKAIDWFRNIKDPEKYAFLKFDIVSFYPSITPKLLENAIKLARSVHGIIISKTDEKMILHCRRSFLFCDEEPWEKIGPENFDVPMGFLYNVKTEKNMILIIAFYCWLLKVSSSKQISKGGNQYLTEYSRNIPVEHSLMMSDFRGG